VKQLQKAQVTQEKRPPKVKARFPEMTEAERKLAEADAYLRKLYQKSKKPNNQQQDDQLS